MMLGTMSLCSISGCSVLGAPDAQPVYMPAGSMAEVAQPARVTCWITNAETGKRERRIVELQPGYWVARPRVQPFQTP